MQRAMNVHIVHTTGEPRSIVKRKLVQRSRIMAKVEKTLFDSETEMQEIGGGVDSLEATKITVVKDLVPLLGRWEDEIRKH